MKALPVTFLISLSLAMGCGAPIALEHSLQSHVASFFEDCKQLGNVVNRTLCQAGERRLIEIRFVDSLPRPGIKGMCETDITGKSTISLLHDKWGQTQLKATLYHELGHCILAKEHDPESMDSIMYPRVQPEWYWEEKLGSLIPSFFASSRAFSE